MEKLLSRCTGNSCGSQMAEGFARVLKADGFEAHSPEVESLGPSPHAVSVIAEAGSIFPDSSRPKSTSLATSVSTGW